MRARRVRLDKGVKAIRTNIWWIRRDLRLSDNQALSAALTDADLLLPLFILDPALLEAPTAGAKRVAFLLAGLRELDTSLRQRGSRLVVRHGQPAEELARLLAETSAQAIFAEEDTAPYAVQRDSQVGSVLPLTLTGGVTIQPFRAIEKRDGGAYSVYSFFRRAWKALPPPSTPLTAPAQLPPTPDVEGISVPHHPADDLHRGFLPGEREALRRLAYFCSGPEIIQYAKYRDRLDIDGTSRLSPYIRFGMLSARQAAVSAQAGRRASGNEEGITRWLDELIWRDFFTAILFHFPHVERRSFRPALQDIPWRNNEDDYSAWRDGRTGYPIVDAAMRELNHNGWIHNRARMIVASFLVKDLLIDWRWGENWFMQQLIDGDLASNNGGWQWIAGTGTDATPYFRIFHPIQQGRRHDPKGSYVRRWVPELACVPFEYIHSPWTMPATVQQETSCHIGRDYPAPIVDHDSARLRTLAAYRSAKDRQIQPATGPK